MATRDSHDNISPLDYRYWDEELAGYLSDNVFIKYKLRVELALVRVLHRRGICSEDVLKEIEDACLKITSEEIYEEESRIRHDLRALVNCLRAKVSDAAKPFIHLGATSYDIIDTANALRYRDAVFGALIPWLIKLEDCLIDLVLREVYTVQIGRTHGQHAVPITFGFAMAEYIARIGNCIDSLRDLAEHLPGKFSGAVGAYNASSLLFNDPEEFEREILAELGLKPGEHSTQIVSPEALTRLFSEIIMVAGVLANLADDMRHLERTEIGEVGETFAEDQVGSSTMPQKRNPITFENAKSSWKIVVPRMLTIFLDQISEHQRDLTNSASARTCGEVVAYVTLMAKRLAPALKNLVVDRENMERNLKLQEGLIIAEPLYIILASLGHPNAHEKVRMLTLQARRENRSLQEVAFQDPEIQRYTPFITVRQRQILLNPKLYTGIASSKARAIAERWKEKLGLYRV